MLIFNRIKILRFLALGIAFVWACGEVRSSEFKQAPLVVVSFTVLKDMVEVVSAQTPLKVVSLVGPYEDPHVYEPRGSDMRLLQAADLIFVNGLLFEPLITTLIQSSGWQNKTHEVAKGLQVRQIQQGGALVVDPHCWHDVSNGLHYLRIIRKALCSQFPDHRSTFMQNAKAYKKKLEALHSHLLKRLAAVPHDQRCAIVEHQAFGYMEDAYGMRFISPLGLSTAGSEPSAKALKNLITQAKTLKARVIFFETPLPSALLRHIQTETKLPLKGRLFSDALSNAKDGASTYIDLMQANGELLYQTLTQTENAM